MDDEDEAADIVELAPELVAIAAKRRSDSVPANNASAESSTAPQVILTIKWIPHPKDEEGEVQTFQFKMRQVSQHKLEAERC